MLTVISVTHDDIMDGEIANCYRCPEALAIQRKLRPGILARVEGDGEVRIGLRDSLWWDEGDRVILQQPFAAQAFIVAYDNDDPPESYGIRPSEYSSWREETVQPFVYLLDIPERFLPNGGK